MARQQGKTKYVRKKEDGLFSKRIVRHVLIVVNLFTIVILLVSFRTGGVGLDALINNWFSFFKTEVMALAGIKVCKEALCTVNALKGNNDNNNDFG